MQYINWALDNIVLVTAIQQGLFAALSGICQLAGWVVASKWFGTLSTLDLGRVLRYFAANTATAKAEQQTAKIEQALGKESLLKGTTGLLLVLLAVSGCSMEAARYRRAAASPLDEQVRMSQSKRPVDRCKVWDGIHVYGDWVAGGLASTAAIAGGLAVQTDSKDFSKGMMWTAVGTGAASAFALGWAEQSASSWQEAGCGQ